MPRVVLATAFGGPEVLSVQEREPLVPGDGQVVIAVRAAGVNPIDVKLYSGSFGQDPNRLPMALGLEAAGVVISVGAGAQGAQGPLTVGQEVVVHAVSGAYAQELLAPAARVHPKPADLPFPQASGLLLTGTTAAHLLAATDVTEGETVLVHGAAGGVGLMVLQLARLRGARVIGTASAGKHELLRSFGAEPVAYGPGLADRVREITAGEPVDAALDLVGSDEAVDTSLELVERPSRVASIAAFSRGGSGIQLLGGGPGADPGTEVRQAAEPLLLQLAAAGSLTVRVSRQLPLSDVVSAHQEIAAGRTVGKIVLLP